MFETLSLSFSSNDLESVKEVAMRCPVCGTALLLDNRTDPESTLTGRCYGCYSQFDLDVSGWQQGRLSLEIRTDIDVSGMK